MVGTSTSSLPDFSSCARGGRRAKDIEAIGSVETPRGTRTISGARCPWWVLGGRGESSATSTSRPVYGGERAFDDGVAPSKLDEQQAGATVGPQRGRGRAGHRSPRARALPRLGLVHMTHSIPELGGAVFALGTGTNRQPVMITGDYKSTRPPSDGPAGPGRLATWPELGRRGACCLDVAETTTEPSGTGEGFSPFGNKRSGGAWGARHWRRVFGPLAEGENASSLTSFASKTSPRPAGYVIDAGLRRRSDSQGSAGGGERSMRNKGQETSGHLGPHAPAKSDFPTA